MRLQCLRGIVLGRRHRDWYGLVDGESLTGRVWWMREENTQIRVDIFFLVFILHIPPQDVSQILGCVK